MAGKNQDGLLPHQHELAKLKAGNHPSVATGMDRLGQTQGILPAIQLSKNSGSSYKVFIDTKQDLKAIDDKFDSKHNEIALSKSNSTFVLKRLSTLIARKNNGKGPSVDSLKKTDVSNINELLNYESK